MGIEKDISQQHFRNDHQKGIINLIYTYNWVNEKMKAFFEREGITGQQFNILRILRGAGVPISTLQIRERMLDKMSDTSRIVDRLVLKGLAQKNPCKNDNRLVDVSITEKGKKLLKKIDEHEQEMDSLFGNLSATEAAQLNKLLDKIRQSK
ncbi:MAG TPA: MarR family transcriptional regulator [Ferruginibacter sp.]|nr:MarR family transcriptional regulator [Ferruginibacter sp.]